MNLNKYIKTQAKQLGKKDLAIQIIKTFKGENMVSQEVDNGVNQIKSATKELSIKKTNQHHSHHAVDVGRHHTIKTTLDLAIKDHDIKKSFCSGENSLNKVSRIRVH